MKTYITGLFLLFIITSLSETDAQIQQTPFERRLGFGAEFGVIGATIDGEYFGMAFSGDYLIGRNFSIAEIISFIPSGNLTMFDASTVARFNIPLQGFSVIPYMGIGFVYGSFSTPQADENSFSMAFPLGAAITVPVASNIEVVGRFQLSITSLDYGVLGQDKRFFELMAGFRYSP